LVLVLAEKVADKLGMGTEEKDFVDWVVKYFNFNYILEE
jgi:hypothetical protein